MIARLLLGLRVFFRYPEAACCNRYLPREAESNQMSSHQREIADGTLIVRSREDDGHQVVALAGELDLANAGTAKSALENSLADASAPVIVDMRELEFIDSTGIALLVSALSRNEDGVRISFIPSDSPAVTRVLELTGLAERLPMAGA
jgi:anti-sigma B factor antagonist